MFEELKGLWTPVAIADSVGASPVGLVLDGVRVALFRSKGKVSALVDQCPHRGVRLSLGKVVDECIECPFHGWRFDGAGACAHVPFNPNARRELLGATALPCVEQGGLIWVGCGPLERESPRVPEGLTREGARVAFHAETWDCHWTRAMENMLDVPHLPFVHAATIGRGMVAKMRPASHMEQIITENDSGFELKFRLDGEPSSGTLQWLQPNGMQLHIMDGDTRFMRIHVWCVPEAANRTQMILAIAQDFGWLNPVLGLGDFYNRKILREDRAVVESSSPARIPLDASEPSVESDKATLIFRKWYRQRAKR